MVSTKSGLSAMIRVFKNPIHKVKEAAAMKIVESVRKYQGILYFQDEANTSLTALLGKTWAPRGKTPKQQVTGNRGGVSAISAITR